jgi:hypothetical protein
MNTARDNIETKLGSEIVESGDSNAIILGTVNTPGLGFNKPVLSKIENFFEGMDTETLAGYSKTPSLNLVAEFCKKHPEIIYWIYEGTQKGGWENVHLVKYEWEERKKDFFHKKLRSPMKKIMEKVCKSKGIHVQSSSGTKKRKTEPGMVDDNYEKDEDEMFRCINDQGLSMEDLAYRIRSAAGTFWETIENTNPNVKRLHMLPGDEVKVPLSGHFARHFFTIQIRSGDCYYHYEKCLQKCREIQEDDLIEKGDTIIVKEPKNFKKTEDIWYTILRGDSYKTLSQFFNSVDIDDVEIIGTNIVKDKGLAIIKVRNVRKVEYYTDAPLSETEFMKQNFMEACRSINVDSLKKINYNKDLEIGDFFLIFRYFPFEEDLAEMDRRLGETPEIEASIGGLFTEREQGYSYGNNLNTAPCIYLNGAPVITDGSSAEDSDDNTITAAYRELSDGKTLSLEGLMQD